MDAGRILDDFRSGTITREQALALLNKLPYEDLGFARLDHHRQIRRGGIETVFCAGKTAEQVRVIFERFIAACGNALGTRATPEQAEYVRTALPEVQYDPVSRLLYFIDEDIIAPTVTHTLTNKPTQFTRILKRFKFLKFKRY